MFTVVSLTFVAMRASSRTSIDRLNEVVEIPKIGAYGQNGCFSFPNAQNPAPQRDFTQPDPLIVVDGDQTNGNQSPSLTNPVALSYQTKFA